MKTILIAMALLLTAPGSNARHDSNTSPEEENAYSMYVVNTLIFSGATKSCAEKLRAGEGYNTRACFLMDEFSTKVENPREGFTVRFIQDFDTTLDILSESMANLKYIQRWKIINLSKTE